MKNCLYEALRNVWSKRAREVWRCAAVALLSLACANFISEDAVRYAGRVAEYQRDGGFVIVISDPNGTLPTAAC